MPECLDSIPSRKTKLACLHRRDLSMEAFYDSKSNVNKLNQAVEKLKTKVSIYFSVGCINGTCQVGVGNAGQLFPSEDKLCWNEMSQKTCTNKHK